jgi:hypothetical protein
MKGSDRPFHRRTTNLTGGRPLRDKCKQTRHAASTLGCWIGDMVISSLLLRLRNRAEIEEDLLGNPVLRCEPTASAKILGPRLFPWPDWICFDGIMITAEVMECAVFVSENLERARCLPNIVVVGLYLRARLTRFNLNQIRDGPVWPPLWLLCRRTRGATCESKEGARCKCESQFSFHSVCRLLCSKCDAAERRVQPRRAKSDDRKQSRSHPGVGCHVSLATTLRRKCFTPVNLFLERSIVFFRREPDANAKRLIKPTPAHEKRTGLSGRNHVAADARMPPKDPNHRLDLTIWVVLGFYGIHGAFSRLAVKPERVFACICHRADCHPMIIFWPEPGDGDHNRRRVHIWGPLGSCAPCGESQQ